MGGGRFRPPRRALPRKRCRRARGLAAGGGPARGGACFRRAAPRGADAGSRRRAEPSERAERRRRRRPGPAAVHHGGQAAHPHGQREAQQEHHAARERRQDLEDGPGGEGVGRALAAGAVHLRGLRISHLPDHPEHPDGHVRGPSPGEARPPPPALPWTVPRGRRPASPGSSQQLPRSGARHRPGHIPGPFTSHSEFSSPCHSALNSTTCIKQ